LPIEIVGQPWSEHGCACLQIRLPQPDGSNLEPVVRIPLAELADQPDDAVAALLAEAVAAEVERHAAPTQSQLPAGLARVLAEADGAIAVEPAA
jgi:hypothetical protein